MTGGREGDPEGVWPEAITGPPVPGFSLPPKGKSGQGEGDGMTRGVLLDPTVAMAMEKSWPSESGDRVS